jgi:hypothetical protein
MAGTFSRNLFWFVARVSGFALASTSGFTSFEAALFLVFGVVLEWISSGYPSEA